MLQVSLWPSYEQQASPLLHLHDCSRIQIQKIPTIPHIHLLRQVSMLIYPSTRQGMHLAASLENSTLRRVLNSFSPCFQVSLRLWASPGLWMQSDLSRMRNLPEQFKTDSLLQVLILPRLFPLPSVSAPSSPSFWSSYQAGIRAASRAEMADVEQTKKIVPFATCEVIFVQNVCELMFGTNVSNPVKQPKQLCGSVTHGTPAFGYHLNHGFVVLKGGVLGNRFAWNSLRCLALLVWKGMKYFNHQIPKIESEHSIHA